MDKELIDPIIDLISSGIHYEVGSTQYNIVMAVTVVAWLVVARVFMGLFQSDRGIFGALLALVLPLILGLLAYGLVDWKVASQIEAEWAKAYLPLGALALVALAAILLLSKRFMQLGGLSTLIVFIFASAVAAGTFYGALVTMDTLEKGGEKIKERDERINEEIDSVL